jgi:peptide/nickel transport system permease protein
VILRRLLRPGVFIGLLLIALLLACALFAELIAPHNPARMAPAIKYLPPIWLEGGDPRFLLGTDQLGRDLLSRIIHGARTSLFIGVSAVAIATVFGVIAGLLAGYLRGWVDVVIMRLADIQLAFPFILLALAILSVTEVKSALTIIVVLAVADWVIHARIVRGRALVEREKEYVRSAKALGASDLRIMFLYVLPAILPTAIVIAMIELAVLMLVESILSYQPRCRWSC